MSRRRSRIERSRSASLHCTSMDVAPGNARMEGPHWPGRGDIGRGDDETGTPTLPQSTLRGEHVEATAPGEGPKPGGRGVYVLVVGHCGEASPGAVVIDPGLPASSPRHLGVLVDARRLPPPGGRRPEPPRLLLLAAKAGQQAPGAAAASPPGAGRAVNGRVAAHIELGDTAPGRATAMLQPPGCSAMLPWPV